MESEEIASEFLEELAARLMSQGAPNSSPFLVKDVVRQLNQFDRSLVDMLNKFDKTLKSDPSFKLTEESVFKVMEELFDREMGSTVEERREERDAESNHS